MTITITGTNDAPTIGDVADIGFTEAADASAQDLSASGTVSFDDIDTNDVVDISTSLTTAAVWSGGSIDPTLKALLEGGFTASVTDAAAPGSTAWDYTVNNADLDFLLAGETITLTYTLTATDSSSATATDTVTITITGTNDAPTISDVADIGFTEAANASAQDLSASGTVSFDDIDTTDVVDISTSLTTAAVWSGGVIDPTLKALLEGGFTASVTDAAAPGSTAWDYTVNNADLDFLLAGETITLTYTLTATDSSSATATDTVTITITGTNDAPTISDVADIGFTEAANASAQDLSASGTVSFDDIDTNDVVDISTSLSTAAVWSGGAIDPTLKALLEGGFTASVTDAAAPGSTAWDYTVNNADLDFLLAGETISLTFTITATDSSSATATDTVTITITGTNDAPTIGDVADIGFTEAADASAQNLSASGTVSFDDIDTTDVVDISTSLSSAAVWSGGVIDPTLKALLEGGFTASVTDAAAPGSTAWDYTANGADLDFLLAGETITLTYTITATDSSSATATDTVTITITGTNDAPTISDVADIGFTEAANASAQDLSASGTVSFDDIDTNDVVDISTSLTTAAVWSGGAIDPTLKALLEGGFTASVTDAAAPGSTAWDYTVNNADLDFLLAGETITLTYTLTATDSSAATATDTVTITITGTNDAPTISDVADIGFTEAANASAQDLSASGTVSFDDIDTNDVVDISTSLSTAAVWSGGAIDPTLKALLEGGFTASVTDAAAPGSTAWDYTVNNADLDFLLAGETITLTYTLTATDSSSATATDTVTITITGTNDAPTISDVADIGFTEAANASTQDLSASGTVSFDDIDTNDVVDITIALTTPAVWSGGAIDPTLAGLFEGGFSAGVADAEAPGNTVWSYNVNNADLDFLKIGETITLTFTITATDSSSATATDTVTITITGTNDAPVATDVTAGTGENTVLNSNVPTASDVDGTIASYALGGTVVAEGNLVFNADGSYSFDPGVDFNDLAPGNSRDVTFTYTATDNDGAISAEQTLTITVTGTNDLPVIGGVTASALTEDVDVINSTIRANGKLTIADADSGESSFQAATINGVHGVLTIDSAGNWNYSADNNTAAIQSLHVGQALIETLAVTTFDGTKHDIVIRIDGAEEPEPLAPPASDPDSESTRPVDGDAQAELKEAGNAEKVAATFENFEAREIANTQTREPLALEAIDSGDVDQFTDGQQDEIAHARNDAQPASLTMHSKVFASTDENIDSLDIQASDDEATNDQFEAMLLKQLDLMNAGIDQDIDSRDADSIKVQIVMGTTTTLTAGIVSWVLRGGSLLASLMSTVPLLKRFDPLPIIKAREDKENVDPEDETEISGLIGENKKRVDNLFTPNHADRNHDGFEDE